ncbi:hypothetical protein VE01_07546 [Pseudogymnoascus verrucosus]|uniref:Exonuclease V n=1 Tax=Pseudogymnoascus verrucosus TaxID=342668 RepID=A0A1B8GGG7_9PEZI|nr:uncharacterized protein VE01_07546 [Pseudogymnoascus verrucosus]OBT94911.1 hypothetical protein VE01_07546 [Pseudogymnoascus verrucosus]
MALRTPPTDLDSDYGSDFSPEDLEVLDRLVVQTPSTVVSVPAPPTPFFFSRENTPSARRDAHPPRSRYVASMPIAYETEPLAPPAPPAVSRSAYPGGPNGAIYPDLSAALSSLNEPTTTASQPEAPPTEAPVPDTRTPLQRYRSFPRKALSVTDLVSPAWCELQYSLTLSLHGRKPRTEAMKRGSEVHAALEEEVYTSVQIEVATKEDAWGLRVWNVIQGLRTLREAGMTRELEVWGVVDGEVVGGVIDEVGFMCPDLEKEEEAVRALAVARGEALPKPRTILPTDQRALDEYLHPTPPQLAKRKLYITDVKTRSVASLPRGASFRPTKLQLMLYHTLLSSLAAGDSPLSAVAARYELDTHAQFSPAFVAQVAALADEVFYDAPSSAEEVARAPDPAGSELSRNNTLEKLWAVMMELFTEVIGEGGLGRVLRAEYRSRGTGGVIGEQVFPMDEAVLGGYIGHGMGWWRGEREPEGVAVQEAFKCRSCEFAEGCEWRLGQVEEARRRARGGWKG